MSNRFDIHPNFSTQTTGLPWTSSFPLGFAWKEKGRGPDGWDCWGLVCLLYRAYFDIELPSYTENYPAPAELAEAELLIKKNKSLWNRVDREQFGDLVLFKVLGHEVHIGFVVSPGKMWHIRKGTRSCMETYDNRIWSKMLVGKYRHPSQMRSE